jgi:glycosyltransferase involved in cell wall biosynthesis
MSISVVIPTFNRFKYLLNAIESVRNQTLKATQIIVVNDGSTQPEYYTHNFGDDVIIIHLSKNSSNIFGEKSPGGIQRNLGVEISIGEYIAFLDDDDCWLPNKLEVQLKAMKDNSSDFSCTEGLFGIGPYDKNKTYKKYLSEHYIKEIKHIFYLRCHLLFSLPPIWNRQFLQIHNCIIASSVMVKKDLFKSIGGFNRLKFADDYECWLRLLEKTNCLFVNEAVVYYDDNHGDGRNYIKN